MGPLSRLGITAGKLPQKLTSNNMDFRIHHNLSIDKLQKPSRANIQYTLERAEQAEADGAGS